MNIICNKDLYECSPNLNTTCRKSYCYLASGECRLTSHKEFSKTGKTLRETQIDKLVTLVTHRYVNV